ncbi:MAG TPA: alpha/beta fold hydrolase [Acidimicrobiales bacterium]|nr:alpha/beta fold hydrolase [Acidimicrobiales bacterium]
MAVRLASGDAEISVHVAVPGRAVTEVPPALVLCHGYPSGPGGAVAATASFPELADRISTEMGWIVMAPAMRGCPPSGGGFSLGNWFRDVEVCVDELTETYRADGVWVVGFGTGGALALCVGAADERVRGVASLAAPADFDDWANAPRRLVQHAREVGILEPDGAVPLDQWQRDLKSMQAVEAAARLAPRPAMLIHGSEDDVVPPFDARVIADAHGDAELRMIPGAGHQLRHDPRAVAVLLGWLGRQTSQVG